MKKYRGDAQERLMISYVRRGEHIMDRTKTNVSLSDQIAQAEKDALANLLEKAKAPAEAATKTEEVRMSGKPMGECPFDDIDTFPIWYK